jgi:undecaprenyl-diphosphatase
MNIIEIIKTIIIGIVEGVTEWLPISSTGHMILVNEWVKLEQSKEYMDMFFVVIQLGAILAVVVLFFNKLNPINPKKTKEERINILHIWFKVLIGVIPAAVVGLIFDDWFTDHLFNSVTVSITLVVYGILFIVIEQRNKTRNASITTFNQLSYKTAFLIGMFQILALVPGTSRSGVTILGAILLGTSRFIAAEYSFFLSIPVMFGASALKIMKYGFDFTGVQLGILLIGMVTAFIISIITIKFLLSYIKNHDFKVFGWYRIVLGVLVIVYYLIAN